MIAAGKASGDLCHPLPYAPEYFKGEFASKVPELGRTAPEMLTLDPTLFLQVADFKNSVKNRANAQVSCAGQFIGNNIEGFLERGGKWCHIDMAFPSAEAERSTGYGGALLFRTVTAHLGGAPAES